MYRTAIVVLGVHRSGTSAMSGMMAKSGLNLGKSVLGENQSNPKGHFENLRLLKFNNSLLHEFDVQWHNTVCLSENWWENESLANRKSELKSLMIKEFNDSKNLLFKDPRLCILLPLYLSVFNELNIRPKFIITLRHPQPVAQSLKKRDNFSLEKSHRIYVEHLLKAERYSRGFERVFSDYDCMLEAPIAELKRIVKTLDIECNIDSEIEQKITGFVEPGLNHSKSGFFTGLKAEIYEAKEIYYLLKDFTHREMDEQCKKQLDDFYSHFFSQFKKVKFPLVSIITISHKKSEDVIRTIMSVANQDYPNIEHLVLCNPDNESEIKAVNNFMYLFSNLIKCATDKRGELLNLGVEQARGNFINILDAGTVFCDSAAIMELVEAADNKNVIVYGNYFCGRKPIVLIEPSRLMSSFRKGNMIHPGSSLLPAPLLKKDIFNPGYLYYTELDLFTRFISKSCQFKHIPKSLTISYTRKSSTASALREQVMIIRKNSSPSFIWLIIKNIQIMYHLFFQQRVNNSHSRLSIPKWRDDS